MDIQYFILKDWITFIYYFYYSFFMYEINFKIKCNLKLSDLVIIIENQLLLLKQLYTMWSYL